MVLEQNLNHVRIYLSDYTENGFSSEKFIHTYNFNLLILLNTKLIRIKLSINHFLLINLVTKNFKRNPNYEKYFILNLCVKKLINCLMTIPWGKSCTRL